MIIPKVLDLTMEEPVLRRQAGFHMLSLGLAQIVFCRSKSVLMLLAGWKGAGDISVFEDVIEAAVFQ